MKGLATICVVAMLACSASATTILYDFGTAETPATGWNIANCDGNITGHWSDTPNVWGHDTIIDAVDSTGVATTVDMYTYGWRGYNGAGPVTTATGYPTFATRDSAFGCMGQHGGLACPNPGITLTGLDPALPYTFKFYSQRNAADNRPVQFTVLGLNSSEVLLSNSWASELNLTVTSSQTYPGATGKIQINVTASPANQSVGGIAYFYLNVLEVNVVPEPATMALLAIGGATTLIRRRK